MSDRDSQPEREPLPLEVEQQVDRIGDDFERAWKAGSTPRIEDYLDRVPDVGRLRLLEELLVVEFELGQQAGDTINVESYRARFRGHEVVVAAALAAHQPHRRGDAPHHDDRGPTDAAEEEGPPDPARIGRFEIRRRLGLGGFGVVYLAHDPGLDRLVAIKVPRAELLATDQQRDSFLQEARTAAKLKHPALITVHEVQQEADLIYIVQEYIEGQNLAQWAAAEPRSWEDITRRMIEITTAIGYVHQQGFYHRDLKPGNVLIDSAGQAHVADFGLAVHEDALRMLKGKAAGTPQYMSPEQVRGETHWIDDRTDIWALGVILYETLSGHRPFTSTHRLELYEEIQERDPKSLRTRNPVIPKELERICFKCLAKRRTHRYANASDLLEDLQACLEACAQSPAGCANERPPAATAEAGSGAAVGTGSTVGPEVDSTPSAPTPTPDSGSQPPLRIVPKGLRSFDKEDKDFFLELLPGPRDREGLPDSIRFWKTRIEEMDADATFAVGVMYGPSGCGKSSLVKAGLLPHLAAHVLPVFVEATPNDTELRLLKALRKQIPRVATEASLVEALAQLREGRAAEGRKVLLVLDQYEQWLHVAANMDSNQLVRAMRQCDGANVQCLILVRDDFWLSTTRFMHALEIPQVENQNSALVDLFDPTHARKVLRAFGLAYGRLPEHDLSAEEQRFLDRAVQDLAHDGKVICVQLSLLADMMKGRPWTPASLQEVGGTSGVGVAFLDETFTAKTAPPTHRLHAKAAQAVLKALLPEVGTDIKGQMRPAERLLECSGYAARPDDFRDLLQILNSELRLITPTEPEEAEAGATEPASAGANRKFYQLTHDYLVPSLRDWLTRKQKETRRGRAQLRLVERSAMWAIKSEHRHLPSWWEYLNIRALTRRKDWTDVQRRMMRAAARHYGMLASGVLALLVVAAITLQQFVARQQRRSVADAVTTLQTSHGLAVLGNIDNLKRLPKSMVKRALRDFLESADDDRKLPLVCALADPEFGEVDRPFLIRAIATAHAEECDNIAWALEHGREAAVAELKNAAATAATKQDWKLKTRLATVSLYLNDTTIAAEMLQAEPPIKQEDSAALKPQWNDPPLDPSWPPAAADAQAAITKAHGLLADRFAFCLDMPWGEFASVMEALRACKYRPTRVRPFVCSDQRMVAAVWTRDAHPWQLVPDLTAEELPPPDSNAIREGLVPAYVAAYPGEGETTVYGVLWSPPKTEAEQRRLRAGMTEDELNAASAQMAQAGFHAQLTLCAYASADGTRRYAAIWSNLRDPTQAAPVIWALPAATESIFWEDISIAGMGKPPHLLEVMRQQLASMAQLPPEADVPPEVRLSRAKALYYLDQPQEALADLDLLASQTPPNAEAVLYGALCRAQLGKPEEARQAAATLSEITTAPGYAALGQILMNAWLGEVEQAQHGLDELVAQCENDASALYNAACAAAQLTRIVKNADSTQIAAWKNRSLELIRKAYAQGQRLSPGIDQDADFAPLYDDADFQRLVTGLTPHSYAVVGRRMPDHESLWIADRTPEKLQHLARDIAAEDFRPVAVSVQVLPGQSEMRAVLLCQRPRIPSATWDPVQRSMFIEHFAAWPGQVE